MRPQNPPIMVSLKQGRKGVEQALEGQRHGHPSDGDGQKFGRLDIQR